MEQRAHATFAGGCFWCLVPPFVDLPGVESITSGYTGGRTESPTYFQVSSGITGHLEAVDIVFDPLKVKYEELLEIFWRQIDPTDSGGQFADRGSSYATAIFYHTPAQKQAAELSRAALEKQAIYPGPIVTQIIPATTFYPAEEEHQDYYAKQPEHFARYKQGSGRAAYLKELWKSE